MGCVVGKTFFYDEITITDTSFPNGAQIIFPFNAARIIIANDAPKFDLLFSFSFPDLSGRLKCCDGPVTFEETGVGRVWFSTTGGNTPIRIWAWKRP